MLFGNGKPTTVRNSARTTPEADFAGRGNRLRDDLSKLYNDICRRRHCTLENDMLSIPLHRDFMLAGAEIVGALHKNPSLTGHVVFIDRGRVRKAEDVIVDLRTQALEFTRKIYREKTLPRHIIVTPPALGYESADRAIMNCRTQREAGRNGEVAIQVKIRTAGDFWPEARKKSGLCQIIQSDAVELQRVGEDWSAICLTVRAEAGMSCEYAGAGRQQAGPARKLAL